MKESTINNFLYLVDINNFKPIDTTECTQKLQQLHKVKELINDLGFKNIYDDNTIIFNDFDINLKLIASKGFYSKDNQFLFNQSKKAIDIESKKAVMGFINTILLNYNLKISSNFIAGKRREPTNVLYKLEQQKNITHVINNLIAKGQDIKDNTN